MSVKDGNMVFAVSPADYRVITQAMMWRKRHHPDCTDGELLAGVSERYLFSVGVRVEKPSETQAESGPEKT